MIPVPSPSMSTASPVPAPSSRAARRNADRQRKRDERQALRDRGAPDPRQLDAAIVDALRDALRPRQAREQSAGMSTSTTSCGARRGP